LFNIWAFGEFGGYTDKGHKQVQKDPCAPEVEVDQEKSQKGKAQEEILKAES